MSALENGVATVICNGSTPNIIADVVQGKKLGTLFTLSHANDTVPVDIVASKGFSEPRFL